MVGLRVDTVASYAALGYCAWQAATAVASCASRGSYRFPTPPPHVGSGPSRVDGVLQQHFVTSHGLALYLRKWLPRFDQPPRGVVFLLHGVGEHGGRYDHVCRVLARRGLAVFSVDYQGQGLSDGDRQHVDKLQHYAEDYLEFVHHVLEGPKNGDNLNLNANVIDDTLEPHADVAWNQLPRFLLSHSMGGTITLLLLELCQKEELRWDGVVLSSPCFWITPDGGFPAPVRLLAWLLPRLHGLPISFEKLGGDPGVFQRWARDPLLPPSGATARLLCALADEGWRLSQPDAELAASFPAPLFMQVAEKDTLTFPQGSINFFHACAQQDKTLKLVPTDKHELFNLGDKSLVSEVLGWMEARLAGGVSAAKT